MQATTLRSLNDALSCLDISVRASNPKFPSDPQGYWNVVDGRALLLYRDGLVSCLPLLTFSESRQQPLHVAVPTCSCTVYTSVAKHCCSLLVIDFLFNALLWRSELGQLACADFASQGSSARWAWAGPHGGHQASRTASSFSSNRSLKCCRFVHEHSWCHN